MRRRENLVENQIKGKKGELIAKEYLISKGYLIKTVNYRNRFGEIDIIATINDILVFVEVKTRTSITYGYAYEAVNKKKQNKIIYCSQIYLLDNRMKDIQARYDIIEVYLTENLRINHIENCF